MKYFLLLFTLLSFACYGQIVITTTADGELHKQVIREALGSIDTPQTDSNPHDFYSADTNSFIGKPKIDYDEIYGKYGATPLPVREFTYPPKQLSLEEKLLLYAQECYTDTIVCFKYKEPEFNDYLFVRREFFDEMFTRDELESRGYRFKYRFAINTPEKFIDEKWEYVFIKAPTFEGFIEWLKKK